MASKYWILLDLIFVYFNVGPVSEHCKGKNDQLAIELKVYVLNSTFWNLKDSNWNKEDMDCTNI